MDTVHRGSHLHRSNVGERSMIEHGKATKVASSPLRRLIWSNLFAQLSEQVALSSAPLVAVLYLSAGPAQTGWLQTAQTLPFLLLSIPVGLAVDRLSRRDIIVYSEVLRAVSLAVVTLLVLSRSVTVASLAALGFVGAIGTVCYSVAVPALVPALVPRAEMVKANRGIETARSSAFAAGPAIGGLVVGMVGAAPSYLLAIALSTAAFGILVGLPRDAAKPQRGRRILADLGQGLAFTYSNAFLRPIVATSVLYNMSWFVLQAVYVAYAAETVGLSAFQIGLTLGFYGIGMVVGAYGSSKLVDVLPYGLAIALGPFSGMVAALIMFLTLWMPNMYLAALSFFLFGSGPMVWTVATTTLRQVITPTPMLGRVSAVIMTATFGARPIGAAVGALMASTAGVGGCLALALAGFVLQFLAISLSCVPRLRGLPDAPLSLS